MPRRATYWQYDVFTRIPFGGNALAIFPEADGISDAEMQALARETHCSETTFVLPSGDPGSKSRARVRIFTPRKEIPFAGHPVVGTAWALVERGRLVPDGRGCVQLELGIESIAPLDVEIARAEGALRKAVMTQRPPVVGPDLPERDWAPSLAALGTEWGAMSPSLAPAVASTGLPFLMVPLASRAAVAALRPDAGPLADALAALGAEGAYAFSLERPEAAFARAFCPGLSVPEDPATGSAAGALGAYLRARGALAAGGSAATLRIAQGEAMARPSEIEVSVEPGEGAPRVGGAAVAVFEGVALLG